MKKLVILSISVILFAYNPQKLEKEDMKTLQEFETLYYNEVIKKEKIDTSLYSKLLFCIKRKSSFLDKIKIKAAVSANNTNLSDTELLTSITLEYNILDTKEYKKRLESILEQKNKALKLAQDYLQTKLKIKQLKNKIKLLKLKEIRLKARQKTGIVNLDERLANLEQLLKTKEQLEQQQLQLVYYKNIINNLCRSIK